MAFVGLGVSDSYGIYSDLGGSLEKVIDTSDLLDGRAISELRLGPDGLNNTGDDMIARPGREIHRPSYRPNMLTIGWCLLASVGLVWGIYKVVRRRAPPRGEGGEKS